MSLPFPEPTGPAQPRAEVLLDYLDYFRSVVIAKVQGLSADQVRTSVLPSGERVLFHLLQEYARHAGHADIGRELLDGTVGE